jgi:DNA polymerase (family 10)
MTNAQVAQLLYEISELMDLKGDVFKRNAYLRAAQSVENLNSDVREFQARKALGDIPGVGEGIAKKIAEYLETGRSTYLEGLRKEFPPGIVQLLRIPDLGPKSVQRLRTELGITSIGELKKAAQEHRIRRLKGFGAKSEENILKGIELVEGQKGRMLIGFAYPIAQEMADYMRGQGCTMVSVAGSLRRMKETVGDLDILVGSDRPERAMKVFTSYPGVSSIIAQGGTRGSVRLVNGVQVDIRVVATESFGAALQYFTGSKEHNIEIRKLALQNGLKVNEYGVFRKDTDEKVGGKDEEEIYRLLGLDPMPPELRENRGEIEAAMRHTLPDLVSLEQIRGDLHLHTTLSDGKATMEELAAECQLKGYEYIGISDHSQSLRIAGGLSAEDMLRAVDETHRLSDEMDINILRGAEVDILEDGTLDYPNSVLKELDYVVASVHSRFKMERREMTQRIIKALSNEHVSVLGHPTGRLIGRREEYQVDMDLVMEAAKGWGVLMELNSSVDRLDLNDLNCIKAKLRGIRMVIGTDAHSLTDLDGMLFGVATARRGWLEPDDVVNTKPWSEVCRMLKR